VPSKSARIGASALGTLSTISVTPDGSRRQMTSRSSTRAGNASTGRSWGASGYSATTREEPHRREGVAARGLHQLRHWHALVDLMWNEPIPWAERHDRDPEGGPQDRAVRRTRHAAEDRRPTGRPPYPPSQRLYGRL